MENVIDKFSLYDFLGYIIPGTLGIWSLSILFNDISHIMFDVFDKHEFIGAIVFLACSYYLGVLLHELSELLQKHLYMSVWRGMPSKWILNSDNPEYSSQYKENIKRIINERYDLVLDGSSRKNQEAFELMYSDVQAAFNDGRAVTYNALYGMYRSFIAGAFFVAMVVLLQTIIISIENSSLIFSISKCACIIGQILAILILSRRLKRFGLRFANAVICDFYILSCNNKEICEEVDL